MIVNTGKTGGKVEALHTSRRKNSYLFFFFIPVLKDDCGGNTVNGIREDSCWGPGRLRGVQECLTPLCLIICYLLSQFRLL